jgi:hypothetical protein
MVMGPRMKGLLALYRYYAHAEVMYYEWHRYNTHLTVQPPTPHAT